VKRTRALARLLGLSAWRGLLGFTEGDNLTYAASIAYYALLSLFPCLLLAFAVLGHLTADETSRNAVLAFVVEYFPRRFEFIAMQLDAVRASGLSLGVAGTLGLIWGALGVFGAITTAVNYAWGLQHAPPRTFWMHKLTSFVMLMVAGATLLIAVLLVSASHMVGAFWFADVLRRFPGLYVLRGLAIRNATTLLFILVVGFVYYFVPNTKVRFRDVWIGAVVTGLIWKGALEAFSWYAGDMSRYTRINGSVGVFVVFLVWIYVQAVILLYGVEFTAAYARLRREQLLQ
jgi:membrane protein